MSLRTRRLSPHSIADTYRARTQRSLDNVIRCLPESECCGLEINAERGGARLGLLLLDDQGSQLKRHGGSRTTEPLLRSPLLVPYRMSLPRAAALMTDWWSQCRGEHQNFESMQLAELSKRILQIPPAGISGSGSVRVRNKKHRTQHYHTVGGRLARLCARNRTGSASQAVSGRYSMVSSTRNCLPVDRPAMDSSRLSGRLGNRI
jgi:hypothetical protein